MRTQHTAEKIRAARQARHWSQFTLAVKAGVHLQTVSGLERGITVRPETLAKIVAALKLPDPPPPTTSPATR